MPRFFFHLFDESVTEDQRGLELPDDATAKRVGLRCAREMMDERVRKGEAELPDRLEVEDELGNIILVVPFPKAATIGSGDFANTGEGLDEA